MRTNSFMFVIAAMVAMSGIAKADQAAANLASGLQAQVNGLRTQMTALAAGTAKGGACLADPNLCLGQALKANAAFTALQAQVKSLVGREAVLSSSLRRELRKAQAELAAAEPVLAAIEAVENGQNDKLADHMDERQAGLARSALAAIYGREVVTTAVGSTTKVDEKAAAIPVLQAGCVRMFDTVQAADGSSRLAFYDDCSAATKPLPTTATKPVAAVTSGHFQWPYWAMAPVAAVAGGTTWAISYSNGGGKTSQGVSAGTAVLIGAGASALLSALTH